MINIDLHDVSNLVLEREEKNLVGFVRTLRFKSGGQEVVVNLYAGQPSNLDVTVEALAFKEGGKS